MIGGSARPSGGSSIIETSGPATATRGAAALLLAALRISKFQYGPPMSTTLVTPLASQTLKVAGRRALLRATSCGYGTTALKSATSGRVYRSPDRKKCTCEAVSPPRPPGVDPVAGDGDGGVARPARRAFALGMDHRGADDSDHRISGPRASAC